MVDGNGDDERKTKYFILSIFICVFAGSFQEKVFKIRYVPNYLVEKWSNPTNLVKKWDKPNFTIHRIVWSTEIFDFSNYLVRWIIRLSESIDSPIFLMHRIRKTRKSMVITSLVWMVSQNLLKSDFILTMEHNKFYWMVSHWNVTILKVRDLRTDQYMKKSYIFPIVKNFELLS